MEASDPETIPEGHELHMEFKTLTMDVFDDLCCKPDTMMFDERKWDEIDFFRCSVCGRRWTKDPDGEWISSQMISKKIVKKPV